MPDDVFFYRQTVAFLDCKAIFILFVVQHLKIIFFWNGWSFSFLPISCFLSKNSFAFLVNLRLSHNVTFMLFLKFSREGNLHIFLRKAVDKVKNRHCILWPRPMGQMYFAFCRLYPFSPQHHGSVWLLLVISLLLTDTESPVQACPAYPYDGRGFVGPKKNTIVCLFN